MHRTRHERRARQRAGSRRRSPNSEHDADVSRRISLLTSLDSQLVYAVRYRSRTQYTNRLEQKMSTTPALLKDSGTRAPFLGNLLMWTLSFLVIPIAGYVGTAIVGRVDEFVPALIGGAFVGLSVGAIQ